MSHTLAALRDDMCRVGASLFARGYVHASAGNISVRVPTHMGGGYLITPTDACLGFLKPNELSWLDNSGLQHSGSTASKTIELHLKIYEADQHAHCIIHTHATYCVATTLNEPNASGDLLPPITAYFVMKVGHVPRIAYDRPGHPNVAYAVQQAIENAAAQRRPIRAVMLDRLGPTVWHETPTGAMALLEELEETAKLWLLSRGQAPSLSDAAINDLRDTFDARW
ncbi:MAG: ribulose-5-phosphate 4-epimerase/fuculose-1-phosphate aldolase [Burkholderiaceae bacterium]|jgi:ribulose-5-phosphate 4-epimerase/fuculose-1-phosphate aldolase